MSTQAQRDKWKQKRQRRRSRLLAQGMPERARGHQPGTALSDAHKAAIAAALRGRPKPAETRAKMAAARKKP